MHQFPEVSRKNWEAKALAVAKGKAFDPERALQGRIDGPAAMRSEYGRWQVFARLDHSSPSKAKAQALTDLQAGADGLVLAKGAAAEILHELPLHSFALRNEAGEAGADALCAAVARQPVDPARLTIDFGLSTNVQVPRLMEAGYTGPFMRGDGRKYHERGCNDAEELGAGLAEAVSALCALEILNDEALAGAVSLTLAASQEFFSTIAKFRAARILWAEILATSKLPQKPLALHGETSRLMMANVDAHSNILRVSTAVFAAGLGGADSICALPFSISQGLPNEFARRVARNSQLLLLHESQLWRVSDPAGGAGVIEAKTNKLCDEAWHVLQACESGHWPSGEVASASALPVIGVAKYMNPTEGPQEVEGAP
jgi:methylmalonyl-CoA mutase